MSHAIYLAGPTASGKSAAALELAERLEGEIISVDSMQVYRGMDIGTAKPSPEERQRIPHHLIDIAALTDSFDAARFVALATAAEARIRQRGRTPIFCGGTGLYFSALAGGLPKNAAPDPELRKTLEATPLPDLLAELQDSDPATFARIDRSNPRRVIRAIEILRTCPAAQSARPDWTARKPSGLWFGLERERANLHQRIESRVDEMFARGLVDETKQLLTCGLRENQTALQALGYRQVVGYLAGAADLPTTIALVKQKTRQYAKRQMTWFRRQLELTWLTLSPTSTPSQIATEIAKIASSQNCA